MRAVRHSTLLPCLALLAVLLLALLPTFGRLLAAPATTSAAATPMALCTLEGLREQWLPATQGAPAQLPAPDGDHPDPHDCDYCPLLAGLLLLLACLLALPPSAAGLATGKPPRPALAPRRDIPHARGPPLSA